MLWRLGRGGHLRCQGFWHAPGVEVGELEAPTREASLEKGGSFPGRAWAAGEPVWREDLEPDTPSERELAALHTGLRSGGAFPLTDGSRLVGVLEFLSPGHAPPDASRPDEVAEVGRRPGRSIARTRSRPLPPSPAEVAPPVVPRRMCYRLDPRHTRLGFSCSFMKFLTVHGRFKDVHGWLEIDNDDVSSLRAECRIQTGSVDTGSMDRDEPPRSPDFFAVDTFPETVFRSPRVQPRGEDRYRVFGGLTIRDVTPPIVPEARLEERTRESSGGERVVVTASSPVNRREWFLDREEALEADRWIVEEEVRLDLELTLISESSRGQTPAGPRCRILLPVRYGRALRLESGRN
ncbi:MAG TPA: YceI family protein [Candidatus Dormibacteraeota bacterium]|nr:YceI family protein [Candidatus Dormibacteraeota bacterium]